MASTDVANPRPGEWPSYNGNLSGNRYSPLREIDTAVARWLVGLGAQCDGKDSQECNHELTKSPHRSFTS